MCMVRSIDLAEVYHRPEGAQDMEIFSLCLGRVDTFYLFLPKFKSYTLQTIQDTAQ